MMYTPKIVADVLSISKKTLASWERTGKLLPLPYKSGVAYAKEDLAKFPQFKALFNTQWTEQEAVKPIRQYTAVEIFAGAGGLALGMEQAGFQKVLLNEIDKHACATLRLNRPHWNVIEKDISQVDFSHLKGRVDLLTGGFPCQAFSYAGLKLGFEDIRGTMFFEFARALTEISPPVFLAENVRGLQQHDQGKTLETIKGIIDELGYTLIEESVYKAIFFKTPQKRERLILIGVKKELAKFIAYEKPAPFPRIMTLKDALKAGELYATDVPDSTGQKYPKRKQEILDHVPEGGYWRDLPDSLQREYMKGSYFLGGGKTGMARRLAWGEPSLTLTCAPAQKQTERCHPSETRPLTTREYARIQTFPDDWSFAGPTSAIYKQIGNAVPVNMAAAIGRALVQMFNQFEQKIPPKQKAEEGKQLSLHV